MTTRLFGCVCGQFHSPGAALGMAAETVAVPVPFYVIEHPDGVAVFDTGYPEALLDPDDEYRQALRAQGLDVSFAREETVGPALERLDIDPARVRYVVCSHLHFDHAGGLHQLRNAKLVVQRDEWSAGHDRELRGRYALPRRFFDLGHDLMLVDGEHDLFGDGSVMMIPSPGHTPGHQSLRVRSEQGDHILVGDACYTCEVVDSRVFPEFSDHTAMNRSLDKLLALRDVGTVMVFGHDPAQWGETPILPGSRN